MSDSSQFNDTETCSTTLQWYSFVADLTPKSGLYITFINGTANSFLVAEIYLRPFIHDINGISLTNVQITTNTTSIAANTCAAGPGSPVSMPGVTTLSVFDVTATVDTSAITGWGATGGLIISPWVTANAFNYKVCNQTTAPIIPGSSVTWNVGAK
jgi:hypothetical protein